jgi:hypothetical protein
MTTWTIDSTTLMILVMIAAGVGFFVGLATIVFRSGGQEIKAPKKDLVEAGRLWRDPSNGQLWIEAGGQAGSSLNDFSGDVQGRVFMIAHELANWAGRPKAPPAATPGAVPAAPVEVHQPPAQSEQAEIQVSPAVNDKLPDETSLPAQPMTSPSSPQPERPRIDIVKGIRLSLEGDMGRNQNQASIAVQVNEILQDKLKGTSLEKRGIRLMELPGKGMVVMVGLEQFDSVGAVPYPEIKAVLQESVAVWEKRMLG